MTNFEHIISNLHNGNIINYIKSTDFYSLTREIQDFNSYLADQDIDILQEVYSTMLLHQEKVAANKVAFIIDLDFLYQYQKVMPFIEPIIAHHALTTTLEHIKTKKQVKKSIKI